MFQLFKQHRVYADYASATPISKRVVGAMLPYLSGGNQSYFGNPSSVHMEGALVKRKLDEHSKKLALALSIHQDEIIFTSNGTESINLAILGVVRAAKRNVERPHVISLATEHSAVLAPLRALEKEGVAVTLIKPNAAGVIDAAAVAREISEHTVLITASLVNGELGTICSMRDIARVVRQFKESHKRSMHAYPYVHTDASQAGALLSCAPHNLGVDFLTLDAGKMYGPKGAGALIALRGRDIDPIFYGGGQGRGLRPGTENVAGIIGLVEAYLECDELRQSEWERLQKLKEYFLDQISKKIPTATLNAGEAKQLPNFVNVCIPKLHAEFAVIELDAMGIAASSASACQSVGGKGFSYVVAALNNGEQCKSSSIRLSFGRGTTKADMNRIIDALSAIVSRHR